MGFTYDEVELYLEGKEISSESKEIIENMNKAAQHKLFDLTMPKEVK